MVLKSSRYLTTPFNNNQQQIEFSSSQQQQHQEEEEFNECDVVWSSCSQEETTTTETTDLPPVFPSTATTTGLSAALEDLPRSPTSIQRRTTSSSPVSMISSSLTRGDGPGLAGYYYGRKFHQSAPVNVPFWPNGLGKKRIGPQFRLGSFDEIVDDEVLEDGETEMVPPHEIVARSHKTTSFSVIEGAGRTLKGRDLTTVRNAVFQKTGFL